MVMSMQSGSHSLMTYCTWGNTIHYKAALSYASQVLLLACGSSAPCPLLNHPCQDHQCPRWETSNSPWASVQAHPLHRLLKQQEVGGLWDKSFHKQDKSSAEKACALLAVVLGKGQGWERSLLYQYCSITCLQQVSSRLWLIVIWR